MKYPFSRRQFFQTFLITCLFLRAAAPVYAEDHYLAANRPDGIALLSPPPTPGSTNEAADLAIVRNAFKNRTPAETARATEDEGLSFSLFARAVGPDFQLNKLPKTHALLAEVRKEIGPIIDVPKDHWKRLRPYQIDGQLSFGLPENSYSYPSGHSTRGTVYSLIIAELYPEKRNAILTVGKEIGWDRVLIGKHFPTDIEAGRIFGKAIFNELKKSPLFQQDFKAAQAEVQTEVHATVQH